MIERTRSHRLQRSRGEMACQYWISVLWFSLSSVVVVWDALFLLLRPRTLPGGDLHTFWKPYELYVWVDRRYGDMADTFGIAQAWLNFVEVCFNLATLTMLLRRNKGALLCGFFVSSLTLWKTVLYLMQYFEFCGGGYMVAHLTWSQFVFLLLVPSGVWVVFPAYFVVTYGLQLQAAVRSHYKGSKKKQ